MLIWLPEFVVVDRAGEQKNRTGSYPKTKVKSIVKHTVTHLLPQADSSEIDSGKKL
jgi:hypothetical protein